MLSSVSGLGRSPGEGNGNPLSYSPLQNHLDRGNWQATVHGAAKGQTGFSDSTATGMNDCYVHAVSFPRFLFLAITACAVASISSILQVRKQCQRLKVAAV